GRPEVPTAGWTKRHDEQMRLEGFRKWARLDSNQGPTDYELASAPRAAETQRDLYLLRPCFPLRGLRRVSSLLFAICLPRASVLAQDTVVTWTVFGGVSSERLTIRTRMYMP